MTTKLQHRKILVTLRKYMKMFFVTEEEFNSKYYDTRIRDNVTEIMLMPVNKRFAFMASIHDKVLQKSIEERDSLQKHITELNLNIEAYSYVKSQK